ncbi:SDR family NAD(P)-dependent oxidoreductase [Rhodoferax sp. U11-2br]|uniref:SDR family NAD(P)-dependent oxidoreductase n=1 Tax=Rhodoferax sp. U11-2br TaxID=2838878 RepID=UPI001BEBEDEE|nr:SDR family oxidoreductase [Rhodoferax sp. U11-2br]MBT3068516.1 SDR family oxidoreductase [Rhodoferax sp. U11-2br]
MSGPEHFLVSGGSGDIGAATCDALAGAGFIPVVGYHRGAAAADGIARRTGGLTLALDLASDTSIDQALAFFATQSARLAGAVLAGSPPLALAPFGKILPDELNSQWQVNVLGPQRLLAGLVRQCFRLHKSGVVVGVLSQAMGDESHKAASGMGAYIIAKYGMAGLLAVLAADYPWLRVRSVRPGYTETRMLAAFDARFLDTQRDLTPFQTPQQVAAQILREVERP